jgi:hypothetical protein
MPVINSGDCAPCVEKCFELSGCIGWSIKGEGEVTVFDGDVDALGFIADARRESNSRPVARGMVFVMRASATRA